MRNVPTIITGHTYNIQPAAFIHQSVDLIPASFNCRYSQVSGSTAWLVPVVCRRIMPFTTQEADLQPHG
jgi:hypothetical protein